ncbi:hypothetical protein D1872_51730 [compost metagenome]
MKKFMEMLAQSEAFFNDLPGENSEAAKKFAEKFSYYSSNLGKKAWLKSGKTVSKVVVIEEVTPHYVKVSYKYHGRDYEGKLYTCINYNSLICGDDVLEVE